MGDIALASRIHETLPRGQFRLKGYLSSRSPLRHSEFLDELVIIGEGRHVSHTDILTAMASGALSRDDWVIFGDDTILQLIVQQGGPDDVLNEILPVRSEEGKSMLGSKTRLAALCERHEIPHPTTTILKSLAELVEHLSRRTTPAVVKGDRGGGGRAVFMWTPGDSKWNDFVDASWFPVVVQDVVAGPLVSVEALFRDGELVGAVYSDAVGLISPLSQSSIRHFRQARSGDYLESLQKMAEIGGLHGFANTSFIWNDSSRRHLLFELDMRPNFWHQFGPRLGINWSELMTGDASAHMSHPRQPRTDHLEAVVHLYPREVDFALRQRRLSPLIPWLRRQPGTWQWRQRADRAVNRLERRSVMRALIQALGFSWLLPRRLPATLTPG